MVSSCVSSFRLVSPDVGPWLQSIAYLSIAIIQVNATSRFDDGGGPSRIRSKHHQTLG